MSEVFLWGCTYGHNFLLRCCSGDGARFDEADSQVRRVPLMQESKEGRGGLQGYAAVKKMELVDEDGDAAMEFFDCTDAGLKKRAIGKAD